MSTGGEVGASAVGRAYEEYAARVEQGEDLDFEAFCADHGELAGELRDLHAFLQRLQGMLRGRPLSQRLAERFGSQADPRVSLAHAGDEPEPVKDPASDFSSDVLGRLAGRRGILGRYALKGEIDRGGQGAVVRVWDEDLRRELAMKILLGKGGAEASSAQAPLEPRSLGRFLEEAQVTGQLDHPGIVPVHELGLDGVGRVYFTMKLVRGRTFKTILDLVAQEREGWTSTRALAVLLKVCEAMAYAHHKGVVHRDLKPGNVMVGRFGEVFVMDWGLAKVLGRPDARNLAIAPPQATTTELRSERRDRASETPDSPLMTLDGDVVGTPAYMPPEQAVGRADLIGPHSDVYAVGAMLYHLVAGHMPYVEPGMRLTNYAVWYQVQKGPPAPLIERAPAVTAELAAICERAMAREIAARYPDMGALSADLSAYLEHRVVGAYQTGPWAEARKWIERNRQLAASLAAALLLLVAGLVTSLVYKSRAEDNARLAARRAEETADQERVATQRANDVLSLSASQDLEDLLARAEELWPAHPDRIEDLERWLSQARELLDGSPGDPSRGSRPRPGLAQHRQKLEELRGRALALTEQQAQEDRRLHPSFPELSRKRAELGWYSRMLALEPWPGETEVAAQLAQERLSEDAQFLHELARSLIVADPPAYGDEVKALLLAQRAVAEASDEQRSEMRNTLAWGLFRAGRFEDALAEAWRAEEELGPAQPPGFEGYVPKLEKVIEDWSADAALMLRRTERDTLIVQVGALESAVGTRLTWEFEDPQDRWWHVQLSRLVAGLEALADPAQGLLGDNITVSHGWSVARRYEFARTIGARSVESAEAKQRWEQATQAIAASTKYGGLELAPQMGLLPIGADPVSGLWEFADLQSGEPAERGADGALVLNEATGLVLVLLPGGTFWMGSQKTAPDHPNYDPQSRDVEFPVHQVELSAFFLSKYEMNQGQWLRITARNPSLYQKPGDWVIPSVHPVEQVSWFDCMRVMGRMGLALPSEAQWEYGCRGGTGTPWWTGAERESLRGRVNIADQAAERTGATFTDIKDWPDLDDGFAVHAPVYAFTPNPFGLFNVHGNVGEWCLDGFHPWLYRRSPHKDPLWPTEGSAFRVYRGGGFAKAAGEARSATRYYASPEFAGLLGLRPARGIGP